VILQTIEHYITYSIISSQPALTYTSAVSTVRLYAVTSGEHAGQTFITWTGNFSSDADAGRTMIHMSIRNTDRKLQMQLRMPSSSAVKLLPILQRLSPRSKHGGRKGQAQDDLGARVLNEYL
jgi:hypothetical protein